LDDIAVGVRIAAGTFAGIACERGTMDIEERIRRMPKAELHLHLEGTLEPELMFALGQRNGVSLPYASPDEARAAYDFGNLQAFLDLYYTGCGVLLTEQDFYDLAMAYVERAAAENIRHAEVFFDPQAHTTRGVAIEAVFEGFLAAAREAEARWGLSVGLIMCFLRHLDASEGMTLLRQAEPYLDRLVAVGLDSSERGNPPAKYQEVFAAARARGLRTVAHAGEEGPPDYVWSALRDLEVSRIDHGVRSIEDAALVTYLAERAIPLTVCPLSNVKLKVFERIEDHSLAKLLRGGVKVTINSDDPSYFGGYLTDNLLASWRGLSLTEDEVRTIGRNAFEASFAPADRKAALLGEFDAFWSGSAA
jgi:adenine deaminase